MNCRFCQNPLKHRFLDLINSPPSNSFLTAEQLNEAEVFFPLDVFVCENCFLVQIDEYQKAAEIFSQDYVYFSSYSKSWLKHSQEYVEMMRARFGYEKDSQVIEIASNDGYLLQYFQQANIPVLGIEPTLSTAQVAREKGIETWTEFFGQDLAQKLVEQNRRADLIIGNNVLAHVPDINDFVAGLKIALKPSGIVTMEFPHLLQLVANNQFDTIYHEHFSYLSFDTVSQIFDRQKLKIFDVQEISTHGGSLRIFAKHIENETERETENVRNLLNKEQTAGMRDLNYYLHFQERVGKLKFELLDFLVRQKSAGKKIAAYGAAAKGNTLLNFCGVRKDLIDFVVDASPFKQGKFLPASHIPVVQEDLLKQTKPDFVFILPWNIKDEIVEQLSYVRQWDGKFVTAVPELQIF